jgi:predicted DNA-binding protein
LTRRCTGATLDVMEVQFTPEQEARLAQIASVEGVPPSRLVQDAVLRLIEDKVHPQRLCPECGHRFAGHGWDGIDAHWRSKHQDVMPYEEAWQLIKAGSYDEDHRSDIEDLRIAERRLNDLLAGRSKTHSLDEVERELGLAG